MSKFREGKSGNPDGRPKGSISITSAIRKKLVEVNPETKRQYLDEVVDVMFEKALKDKDFRVIKEIWNHIDGSPKQTTEELGAKELPVPIMGGLSVSREATARYLERNNTI